MLKLLLDLRNTFVKIIDPAVNLSLEITYLQGVFQYSPILSLLSSGEWRKDHKFSIFRMGEDEVYDLVYRYFSYLPAALRAI